MSLQHDTHQSVQIPVSEIKMSFLPHIHDNLEARLSHAYSNKDEMVHVKLKKLCKSLI